MKSRRRYANRSIKRKKKTINSGETILYLILELECEINNYKLWAFGSFPLDSG